MCSVALPSLVQVKVNPSSLILTEVPAVKLCDPMERVISPVFWSYVAPFGVNLTNGDAPILTVIVSVVLEVIAVAIPATGSVARG